MPSVSDFKLTSNSAKVGLLASTAAAPITTAAASTSPASAGVTVRAKLAILTRSTITLARGSADVIVHAMALGDALNTASKTVDHGDWADWVAREGGGLSLRSAQQYMRLADHRVTVEAMIAEAQAKAEAQAAGSKTKRVSLLTINGVLRRLGNGKTCRTRHPPSDLKITVWQNASADQRTAFFGRIPTAEIIGALTPAQRAEIENHLNGQITSLKAQVATLKKQVEMSVPIVPFKMKRAA